MTDKVMLHHRGLPYAGLRDYIVEQALNSNIGLGIALGDENNARTLYRAYLVETLAEATKALESFDQGCSYANVMRVNGWRKFQPPGDLDADSFVGTLEEFESVYGVED